MKYIILTLLFAGCTNAQWSKVTALGKQHDVKCWSGGTVIYEGQSTGAVENEKQSDGYYFQDAATGKMVTVSGNCVITVAQ